MQKSGLLSMIVLAIASLSATAVSQSYEYVWAKSLMQEFRYEDMAEVIFTKLSKDSDKSKAVWGIKGLGELKRRQALLADSLTDRAKFNDECITMLRKVSKSMKRGTLPYFETLFDLARIIQDVVSEDIRFINEGRVPSDQIEDLRKKNLNRLAEAAQIYERAAATLEAMTENKVAQNLSKRALLDKNVVLLLKAELIGTDPKKLKSPFRNEALVDAVDALRDFALYNAGSLWEMYAYVWLGRVHGAQFEGGFADITIGNVDEDYWYVYEAMSIDEGMGQSTWAGIVSQSLYWEFEFLNKHGATDLLIAHGDTIRKRYEELKWEYDFNGRMALIQLGKAYQTVGRSGEALDIAAFVSAKGGYAGQEADKLMSLIIKTAENKDQFSSEILASGANGAWAAARKNPEKYAEAIQLYQIVLDNLHKVTDPLKRNLLGRQAYYRIGKCNDKLGRSIEAYIALEQAYKKFNNEQLGENRKENQQIAKYWRAVATDLVKASSNSAFAAELRNRCNEWVIAHRPRGVEEGGTMPLLWGKAMGELRSKDYPKALKSFEMIAKKPSEYQERGMVKVAVVTMAILKKNKGATAPDWRRAAKKFEDYLAHAAQNKEDDPLRKKSRRAALIEAHFQLTECYAKAAVIEQDLAVKAEDFAKIRPHAEYVLGNTKDENIKMHARYNILGGLLITGQGDQAFELFEKMYQADPGHKLISRSALKVSKLLRKKYEAMPQDREKEVEARNKVQLQSTVAYRAYLLTDRNARKRSAYWPRGISGFYDLKMWKEAEELIDKMLTIFGSKLPQKMSRYANRRKARCILERAKVAFAAEKTEEADRLFALAAPVYNNLVGEKNRGTNATLEEAAQIFGGFLTAENRYGRRSYYPGTAEFKRAADIWKKLQRRFLRDSENSKSAVEAADFRYRSENARVYTFLVLYQWSKAENDTKLRKKLKKNVSAVFLKTAIPGGPKLVGLWEWLRDEL